MIRTMSSAGSLAALALAALALTAAPARANLVITVQPSSATLAAGSTGNTLEVLLRNDDPSDVAVEAFAFRLSVSSDVTFTGSSTTTSAAAYIFAGDSFVDSILGGILATSLSPFAASDLAFTTPATVASGATVSLGTAIFSLSAQASGTYTISLDPFPATGLTVDGADFPDDQITLVSGTFEVGSAPPPNAVPEPSTLTLAGLSLVGLAAYRRRAAAR